MKRRIALIYGGQSAEHEVSVMGYGYMLGLLRDADYDIISVYIDKNGDWRSEGRSVFPYRVNGRGELLAEDGERIALDAAIPLLHGDGGESGEIQGLLRTAGIPFIGADVSAGSVCLDKHYTKCIAARLGIPVAKWVIFPEHTDVKSALALCEENLSFPIFLKPRRLGSSVGAYTVKDREDFCKLFPKAQSIGGSMVMAEELIANKRELECAFYSALGKTFVSIPGEILNDGFYGYNQKYVNSAKTSVSANIGADVKNKIREYSLLLAETCRLRHLGRIDYFLTDRGLIFNEINTFPGFTSQSLYPKMIKACGIDPREALAAFIEDAIGC